MKTGLSFELSGEFGGFVRDEAGKRRLLLRVDGREELFKVPGDLRRQWAARLVPGQTLALQGAERRGKHSGQIRRVIVALRESAGGGLPSGRGDACSRCALIRICTKKNCFQRGGRELWETLESRIARDGHAGAVRLKGVHCMDRCKKAPLLECEGRYFERCTPQTALEVLERALNAAAAD